MTAPTAKAPWTVTLCWTPGQNNGRVSILDGRAPVAAIVGLLRAGEQHAEVAAEFGCTVEAVEVLHRLADEAGEWNR